MWFPVLIAVFCQQQEVFPWKAPEVSVDGVQERIELAAPDAGDSRSEALGAQVDELLERMGRTWAAGKVGKVLSFFASDAALPLLRPEQGHWLGDGLPTSQWTHWSGDQSNEEQEAALTYAEAWLPWNERFSEERSFAAKVVDVQETPEQLTARAWIFVSGRGGDELREAKTLWRTEWIVDGTQLHLQRLVVEEYTEHAGPIQPLFRDATDPLLGGLDSTKASGLLAWGLEDLRARLDRSLGVGLLGHHGVAVGDVNGDGLEDLYLGQPGGVRNLLLVAQPEGGFQEGRESGAAWLDSTRGVLILDFTGDGQRDLALAMADEVVLMSGDGKGHFEVIETHVVPSATSLAAADVDLDGDLDLYACGYSTPYSGGATPVPYHDANNGQPNSLLINRGNGRFDDRTESLGMDVGNRRFSFAASFEDYDGDGDLDLYVANDFGRNNLYRNALVPTGEISFQDVAAEAGVEDLAAGMGVTWEDVNLDGFPDLFVSNMWSSAGQRVGGQAEFQAESEGLRGALQRHAKGSSLFLGTADGTFVDASAPAEVEMGRWAWGGLFVDLDGDPWLDLCVPNGFVTGSRQDDL